MGVYVRAYATYVSSMLTTAHTRDIGAVAETVINHREPQHNLYRRPHHSQRESPTKAYRGTMDGDQEMNEFDDFNESTTSLTVSELGKVKRLAGISNRMLKNPRMSMVSATLAVSDFPVEFQGENGIHIILGLLQPY